MNRTFATTACRPLSGSGASCACEDVTKLDLARDCITASCTRKDTLSSLNVTFMACTDKPIRDKSVSYRHLIVAFYILAVTAMVAQWAVRFTVGRLQWLDDCNMLVVLAVNTVLFVMCYKMSFTGLGRDMWNIAFPDITSTLLVRLIVSCIHDLANSE